MFIAIRNRMEREEGFTLIELLVVVIIIGILAAVAIPTFLGQRQRAYRAAIHSDLRNLAVEAETHYTDAQTYAGFVKPTGFGSTGVTSRVADLSATGFCLSAYHTSNSTEIWKMTPGNKLEKVGGTVNDCTAPTP